MNELVLSVVLQVKIFIGQEILKIYISIHEAVYALGHTAFQEKKLSIALEISA